MNATQPVLIDMTTYLPTEGTIDGAVAEAEVEQAAAEAEAATVAEGIRAMIAAPLADGAEARLLAAFTPAEDTAAGVEAEDTAPEVDVEALGMSPKQRALVAGHAEGGPWHYQARKGAHNKGLTTDIKASALTELGERVRAALLAD